MLSWLKGGRKAETRRKLIVIGATGLAERLARAAAAEFDVTHPGDLDMAASALPDVVLVAQGDEPRDLETAKALVAARQATPGAPAAVLGVVAQSPAMITALLDLDSKTSGMHVRPLSLAARTARSLLAEYPFWRLQVGSEPLHPVIFGTGPQAAHLVLQLFRMMHLPGLTPRATIVGADAAAWLEALLAEVPGLRDTGAVTAADTWTGGVPSVAYVIDATTFASAGALPWYVPVYWLADGDAPDGAVKVAAQTPDAAFAALLADPADAQAEAIHQLYLEERRQANDAMGSRPSMQTWTDLPERFRTASRHQADHIAVKVAHIGCHIVPADGGMRFGFSREELETLSEAEHLRWAAVQMLDGWRFGPKRDDAAKLTPLLVPYSALTGEIRDLDRLSVRAIPAQLDRVKRTIHRNLVIGLDAAPQTEPGAGFEAGLARLFADIAARYPQRVIVLTTSLASAIEARAAQIVLGSGAARLAVTLQEPEALDASRRALARQAEQLDIGRAPPSPDLVLHFGEASSVTDAAHLIVLGPDGRLRSAPWQ